MEREVGGGIGMGNTCKPLAVSFQCMTKSTTNKKKKKKEMVGWYHRLSGHEFEQTQEDGEGQGKPGILQSMGSQSQARLSS